MLSNLLSSPLSSALRGVLTQTSTVSSSDPQAEIAAMLALGGDAWTLDELTGDFVGSANATVAVRSGALDVDPAPHVGSATFSDAASKYIDFPFADGAAPLVTGGPFTLVQWLKFNGTAAIPPASVGFFYVGSNDYTVLTLTVTEDGVSPTALNARLDSMAFVEFAECEVSEAALAALRAQNDGWIMVTVSHDGDGTLVLDLNAGAESRTDSIPPGEDYNISADFGLIVSGCQGTNGNAPPERDVWISSDEVLIVPEVLSAAQISWLYNGGAGRSMSLFA